MHDLRRPVESMARPRPMSYTATSRPARRPPRPPTRLNSSMRHAFRSTIVVCLCLSAPCCAPWLGGDVEAAEAASGESTRPSSSSADAKGALKFELDVMPILTAAGCNSGPCHGKQRGQNGFQLSLLGFDHDFDFNA